MIIDWERVGEELEDYYGLFYSFWNAGVPVENESIPTAAVSFDRKGKYLNFQFNSKFWNGLTFYERVFVVSHEMLHLILNHGARMVGLDPNLANIAMDVVVNESLVEYYGFNRGRISFQEDLCWLDTVFENTPVLPGQNFEYYYDLLEEKYGSNMSSQPSFMFIDDASTLNGNDIGDIAKEIHKKLSDFDKEDFEEELGEIQEKDVPTKGNLDATDILGKQAGTGSGKWEAFTWQRPPVLKKWYKLFRNFIFINTDSDEEQWARPDRRFTELPDDLILPSEHENLGYEKEKVSIWLFLDISGSCYSLRHTFLKTYETIPKDKFVVRLFTFDTWVKEVDLKSKKIYGGGGTSFRAIEKKIQEIVKRENKKYPKIVCVFTDGYGDYIQPQHPERWYWFLTSVGSGSYHMYDGCIPEKSHKLALNEYTIK